MKRRSRLLQVLYETAKDFYKAGVMSDETLREIETAHQKAPKKRPFGKKKAPDSCN